jgi:hypothetical protein
MVRYYGLAKLPLGLKCRPFEIGQMKTEMDMKSNKIAARELLCNSGLKSHTYCSKNYPDRN